MLELIKLTFPQLLEELTKRKWRICDLQHTLGHKRAETCRKYFHEEIYPKQNTSDIIANKLGIDPTLLLTWITPKKCRNDVKHYLLK